MHDRLRRIALKTGMRLLFKTPGLMPLPADWLRRGMAGLAGLAGRIPDSAVRQIMLGGIACEQHGPAAERAVLYLHGGAFFAGSPRTHRQLAQDLVRQLHAVVHVIDYRLAPEHPYPAALEDALAAWHGLRAMGFAPRQIIVAGDSAGGGLALSLSMALRDLDSELPRALLLISPFTDLTLSSDAMHSLARRDPLLSRHVLRRAGDWYRYNLDLDDPRISPLHADCSRLPPTLVQVGSEEILLDDALGLEVRVRAAGGCIECQIWPGMWHDFPLFHGRIPEAGLALAAMARFIDAVFADQDPCRQ